MLLREKSNTNVKAPGIRSVIAEKISPLSYLSTLLPILISAPHYKVDHIMLGLCLEAVSNWTNIANM